MSKAVKDSMIISTRRTWAIKMCLMKSKGTSIGMEERNKKERKTIFTAEKERSLKVSLSPEKLFFHF